MEERHRKPAWPIGEQSEVVPVADFSPFLIIDLLQHLGRWTGRRIVWRAGAIMGLCLEKVVCEWRRRIELEPIRLRAERFRERIHRCCGRGRALEQRAAI